MTTLRSSPQSDSRQTELGLTLFAAASRAKTFRSPNITPSDSMVSEADCGFTTPGSFASFDRDSCSWKTFQVSLDGALVEFSETWPRSGMMRNGTAFQLPTLAPRMVETEYGLLPTPIRATGGRSLTGAVWKGRSAYTASGRKLQVDLRGFLKRAGYKTGVRSLTRFSEWMMGFPQLWTDTMLSRTR